MENLPENNTFSKLIRKTTVFFRFLGNFFLNDFERFWPVESVLDPDLAVSDPDLAVSERVPR